jgi:hypothetical protein
VPPGGRGVVELLGLVDVAPDEPHEKRRHDRAAEQDAPAVLPEQGVDQRGDQEPGRVAGHHHTARAGAVAVPPCLGHQGRPHGGLDTRADAGDEPQEAQLPPGLGERAQRGEHRVRGDSDGQHPHPAGVVGEYAEEDAAGRPADQEDHDGDSAVQPDARLIGRDSTVRQQLGHGRADDQDVEAAGEAGQCPGQGGTHQGEPLMPGDLGVPRWAGGQAEILGHGASLIHPGRCVAGARGRSEACGRTGGGSGERVRRVDDLHMASPGSRHRARRRR